MNSLFRRTSVAALIPCALVAASCGKNGPGGGGAAGGGATGSTDPADMPDDRYIHLLASEELQRQLALTCTERIKLKMLREDVGQYLTQCAAKMDGQHDRELEGEILAQAPTYGTQTKAILTPDHITAFCSIAKSFPAPQAKVSPAAGGGKEAAYMTVRYKASTPPLARADSAGPHRVDMAGTHGDRLNDEIKSIDDALNLLASDRPELKALGASWLSAASPNNRSQEVLTALGQTGWEAGSMQWRGAYIAAYMRWDPAGKDRVLRDISLFRDALPYLLSANAVNIDTALQTFAPDANARVSFIPGLQDAADHGDVFTMNRAKSILMRWDVDKRMAGSGTDAQRAAEAARAAAEAARIAALNHNRTTPGNTIRDRDIDVQLRRAETGSDLERRSALAALVHMTPQDADVPRVRDAFLKNADVNDASLWNDMATALKKMLKADDADRIAARIAGPDSVDARVRLAMLLLGLDAEATAKALATIDDDASFFSALSVPLKALGPPGEDTVLPLMHSTGLHVRGAIALILDVIGTSKSLSALNEALRDPSTAAGAPNMKTNAGKAVRDITSRLGAEMAAHPEQRAAAEKELADAGVTLDPKATPEQVLALLSRARDSKEVIAAGFKVDIAKVTVAQLTDMQTRIDLARQVDQIVGTHTHPSDYSLTELKTMRDKAPIVKDLAVLGVKADINRYTRPELESMYRKVLIANEIKTKTGKTVDISKYSEDELKLMRDK